MSGSGARTRGDGAEHGRGVAAPVHDRRRAREPVHGVPADQREDDRLLRGLGDAVVVDRPDRDARETSLELAHERRVPRATAGRDDLGDLEPAQVGRDDLGRERRQRRQQIVLRDLLLADPLADVVVVEELLAGRLRRRGA